MVRLWAPVSGVSPSELPLVPALVLTAAKARLAELPAWEPPEGALWPPAHLYRQEMLGELLAWALLGQIRRRQ